MTDDLKQRAAQVERLLSALPSLEGNELWQFLLSELQGVAKQMGRSTDDSSYALGYRAATDDLSDSIDRLKVEATDIAEALLQEQKQEEEEATRFPNRVRSFFSNLIS
jgi:hypothetical protein